MTILPLTCCDPVLAGRVWRRERVGISGDERTTLTGLPPGGGNPGAADRGP